MTQPAAFRLPAPAKINLGLRVLGRRSDGYHLLQTAFQLLSYGDYLRFQLADKLRIETRFHGQKPHIAMQDNLVYRAAQSLKQHSGFSGGAQIKLDKYLPVGAGLGGGSSDAATTLLGLNYLWQTGLDTKALMQIAVPLGADVAVFVMGKSAWAEGIGEELTAIDLPHRFYLLIKPRCNIETAEIFSQERLTRDASSITIARFLRQGSIDRNDCEAIVCQLYPEVKEALSWMGNHGVAKMTGTGSCVFCAFASRQAAEAIFQTVPARWSAFVAEGLNQSPLITALKAL